MPLEKNVIKAAVAGAGTFDFKPSEFSGKPSASAKSFVDEDSFKSPDFKISEIVAQQTGISRLESDAQEDRVNAMVLDKLKEIQERGYQEGYELGLAEGTEKAFQEAKGDLLEKMKSLENILSQMETLKTRLLNTNEGELIKLVYLTAKKIAVRDLEQNREAMVEILKNVMQEAQADERITVRLAKSDLDFLNQLQEKSGTRIESLQRVNFVVDETITPGGGWVDAEYGSVNATVEERLDRTWTALQARIPQNRTGQG